MPATAALRPAQTFAIGKVTSGLGQIGISPDTDALLESRKSVLQNHQRCGFIRGLLMAEVLLFHHAQGLTLGVRAFADSLRAAGHIVHTPDLFDGHTFDSINEGLTYIGQTGFDVMRERGVRLADELPRDLVYAGFSFGVLPAQKLAQTREGARGALLFYACLPISGEWAFGPWPLGVPVQIHGMDNDPIFVGEGDINAAREIVEKAEDADLFLYPGDQHYFADSSLSSYDADATLLLTSRVLKFLDRV
jgi:dienelactone hydrolase